MASYLLDTNTLSFLIRRHTQVEARLTGLSVSDWACTCVVARGEILFGIEVMAPGRKRNSLTARARSVLARIPCEPIPVSAAEVYARIKVQTRRAGASLDENDLWIAATALVLGAVLITSDTDFARVQGLRVEDWTK